MELIIELAMLALIVAIPLIKREYTFNNRISPNGTDYGAMNRDLAAGMSKNAVKDKFNRGGYDMPKK